VPTSCLKNTVVCADILVTIIDFYYISRESWPDLLNYQQLNKFLERSSNQSTMFLSGTEYFDYSDAPLFSPYMQIFVLTGVIPAKELAQKLEDEIVSFF